MKQLIFNGVGELVSNSSSRYSAFMCGAGWSSSYLYVRQPLPTDGVIRNMRVMLSENVSGGGSLTFTLVVDGNMTDLAVTIPTGSSTGYLSGTDISVTAGQTVCIRSQYSGTVNTPSARFAFEFESNTPGESIIMGNGYRSTSTNYYTTPFAATSSTFPNTSETEQAKARFPTSGTLKKLYACTNISDTDALDFIIRYDGAATALAASIVEGVCTPDLSNTVAVAEDHLVSLNIHENGDIAAAYVGWGMVFVPDTDGEFVYCLSTNDNPTAGTPECKGISSVSSATAWNADLAYHLRPANAGVVAKKLKVHIGTAPGEGKSRYFTLRKVDADGNVSATDLAVTFSDAETDEAVTADADLSDGDSIVLIATDDGNSPDAFSLIQTGLVLTMESTFAKSVADSMAISEGLAMQANTLLAESLGVSEGLAIYQKLIITDVLSLAEDIAKLYKISVTDSLELTDAV